jgi:hypothetical protein
LKYSQIVVDEIEKILGCDKIDGNKFCARDSDSDRNMAQENVIVREK